MGQWFERFTLFLGVRAWSNAAGRVVVQGGDAMPAIVEFPRVVSDELERFADLGRHRHHDSDVLFGVRRT